MVAALLLKIFCGSESSRPRRLPPCAGSSRVVPKPLLLRTSYLWLITTEVLGRWDIAVTLGGPLVETVRRLTITRQIFGLFLYGKKILVFLCFFFFLLANGSSSIQFSDLIKIKICPPLFKDTLDTSTFPPPYPHELPHTDYLGLLTSPCVRDSYLVGPLGGVDVPTGLADLKTKTTVMISGVHQTSVIGFGVHLRGKGAIHVTIPKY